MERVILEYIWFTDGMPISLPRSKKRIYRINRQDIPLLINEKWRELSWTFDGSSTNSIKEGDTNTEIILKPVRLYESYDNQKNHYLLYCSCYYPGTNENIDFRDEVINKNREDIFGVQLGFEQEYFLENNDENYPQNSHSIQYYCGVGDNVGRLISDLHIEYCINAGINIVGTNAEVVRGQWEYQIFGDLLKACDDLMVSRYLLYLVTEQTKMKLNLHPKPYDGVNGSGCHINISTIQTRKTINAIHSLMREFEKFHQHIIECSGIDNHKRLSGKYETSNLSVFSYGIGTRNTSVRIPIIIKEEGCGYFEDRRPASNVNPYEYCIQLLNIIEENYLENSDESN